MSHGTIAPELQGTDHHLFKVLFLLSEWASIYLVAKLETSLSTFALTPVHLHSPFDYDSQTTVFTFLDYCISNRKLIIFSAFLSILRIKPE